MKFAVENSMLNFCKLASRTIVSYDNSNEFES